MNLSLNEVEATAKKATRGAGYPWGLAEEAAKATRWLCGRGMDGCAALAGLLSEFDGADIKGLAPRTGEEVWEAAGGTLCPLITGAAISDNAKTFVSGGIGVGKTAEPVLLVPFAAYAAQQREITVSITWPGFRAVTDGDQLEIEGIAGAAASNITVVRGGQIDHPGERYTRAEPRAEAWETLNRFARRTYAPATEESRLKGAGAGLSDND